MSSLVSVIGALAAIASTTSFAPQTWHIIRTRNVDGLSPGMYALTVIGFALWLSYGSLLGDWALMIPNAICLLLSLFILAMILLSALARNAVADAISNTGVAK